MIADFFLNKKYLKLNLIFFCSTFISYFTFLSNWGTSLKHDWLYFNIFSLIFRTQVFGFGQFPMHNPYLCGGLDLLANPQTRYFSPLIVLDLLFEPFQANLISLMFYTFVGLWGAYLLFCHLKVNSFISVAGAIIFVNGSWFGLHFSEGHIVFGTAQLIPFILYATYNLEKPRFQLLFIGLFAWLVIDPAFYTIVLSVLSVLSLLIIHPGIFKGFLGSVMKRPLYVSGLILAFFMISAVKIFPVLANHSDMVRRRLTFNLDLSHFFNVFFNPFQEIIFKHTGKMSMLEYGLYLGIISFLMIFSSFFKKDYLKQNLPYALICFFWFSEAAGFIQPYSFWNFYQTIPILRDVSNTNVLTLLIFFVFYMILWVRALNGLNLASFKHSGKLVIILLVFFIGESIFVRNFPVFSMYENFAIKPRLTGLLMNDNLDRTVYYAGITGAMRTKNTGAKICYESVFGNNSVVPVEDPAYRGEIYFTRGKGGFVSLDYFSFGNMVVSYASSGPSRIRVNTNFLNGWVVLEGEALIEPSPGLKLPLLDIVPQNNQGEIHLVYRPWYFEGIVISYFSGWILLFYLYYYSGRLTSPPCRKKAEDVQPA